MRIVAISDTHLQHKNLVLPPGDLLVHAGDFSNLGKEEEVLRFAAWFRNLPYEHKLVVPGNHDRDCETNSKYYKDVFTNPNCPGTVYYEDSGLVKVEDKWILCYSWTSEVYSNSPWKFTYPRNDPRFDRFWEYVPPCDILVTHGPPAGILDLVDSPGVGEDPHVGCSRALKYVYENSPKIHIFGHVHESYGQAEMFGTKFYNVAVCNLKYEPVNPITVIDL